MRATQQVCPIFSKGFHVFGEHLEDYIPIPMSKCGSDIGVEYKYLKKNEKSKPHSVNGKPTLVSF